MTDELERHLRTSFVRADLPMAPERLRQLLLSLPATPGVMPRARVTGTGGVLRLAAAFGAVLLAAGGIAFGFSNLLPAFWPSPTATASPTPTLTLAPSPSPTPLITPAPTPTVEPALLPEVGELLAGSPDAEVAWQGADGPADRPISTAASLRELLDEPFEIEGDLVLAGACRGPGELRIEMRPLDMPDQVDLWQGLVRPCDGYPSVVEYSNFRVRIESIRVPAGASWRMAIGSSESVSSEPVTFSESIGTDGWWQLWDIAPPEPVSTPNGTGAAVRLGDDVTRVAIWVECIGDGLITLTAEREPAGEGLEAEVSCPTDDPERYELAVQPGEELTVKAVPAEPTWVRVYIESNAVPVSTYGPAPELPDDLAQTPFSVASGTYVALGRLGGARQSLVLAPGARANQAVGDFALVIPIDRRLGSRLDLYSVETGEHLRTLAEQPPGEWITSGAIDLARGQVFYEVSDARTRTVRVHRVGLDGSDHGLVMSAAVEEGASFASGLVGEVYLLDGCHQPGRCTRWLISGETLEVTEHVVDLGGEFCGTIGAAEDLVAVRVGTFCQAFGADMIVVTRLDGTGRQRLPDVGPASIVRTQRGPQILHGAGTPEGLQIMSIETGRSRPVGITNDAYSRVDGIRLPEDWILLAPFHGIGDFPANPMFRSRDLPPLLVNVITGEIIELVNLPH